MYLITKQYENVKDLGMFTVNNNMIDVKKGRGYFQISSSKENDIHR